MDTGRLVRRLLELSKEEKAKHRGEDMIVTLHKHVTTGKIDFCSIFFKIRQSGIIKKQVEEKAVNFQPLRKSSWRRWLEV